MLSGWSKQRLDSCPCSPHFWRHNGGCCLLKVEEGTVQIYMQVSDAALMQSLSDTALKKKGKSTSGSKPSKPKFHVFNLNLCNYLLKKSLHASSHPVPEEDILATPGVLSFVSYCTSVFFSACHVFLQDHPAANSSFLDITRSREWVDYVESNTNSLLDGHHNLFCWTQSIMKLKWVV